MGIRLKKYFFIVFVFMLSLGIGQCMLYACQESSYPIPRDKIVVGFDIHKVILKKNIGAMIKKALFFHKKCALLAEVKWSLLRGFYQLSKKKVVTGEQFANLALQHDSPTIAEFIIMLSNTQEVIEGTVAVIKELADNGVPMIIMSNIGPRTFADLKKQKPNIFNDIVFDFDRSQIGSYTPGQELYKPDPAYYQEVIDKNGEKYIIFIDDMRINIESAQAMGLQAIQFYNADQLRNELARYGLVTKTALMAGIDMDGEEKKCF